MCSSDLIPPLAGLAVFLAIHAAVWQVIPRPRKGTLSLLLCAAAAYAAVAGVVYFRYDVPFARLFWTSGPLYAFLVMLYFHFYFGLDRSVSVRMLNELTRAPEGRMTLAELDAVYPRMGMVEHRMNVMVEKGFVAMEGPYYRCTAKGLRFVRFALFGKRLYNLDAQG